MNEREFIARVESANTADFIRILSRPNAEEDRILRLHLGSERYERLRQLALRSRTRGAKKGNVIVLHGIMGSELTVFDKGKPQHIWMNFLRLVIGGAGWLRMRDLTSSFYDVRATGILKKWYSEMLLSLAQEWNVQAFWYDWRRDLSDSADALNEKIKEWFRDEPFHLVGHSMGGLVSRRFISKYGKRWKRAWKGDGVAGGRLVMLGTPNHGSFSIPQICTGTEESVRKLAIADLKHNTSELVGIVNSFPGSYQMLPSTAIMANMEPLYRADTYGNFGVSQALLDNARRTHEALHTIVDKDRMIYVAGYNRRTYDDIRDWSRLNTLEAYATSMNGDGTVPHRLGFLEQDGKRIPTYFANAQHGGLPNDASVVAATLQILDTGRCDLPQTAPVGTRSLGATAAADTAERLRISEEEMRVKEIAEKTRVRTRAVDAEATPVSPEEKEAEQLILRSFLSDTAASWQSVPSAARETRVEAPPASLVASIEIGLIKAGIESVEATSLDGQKVDVVAVGHYRGVRPQAAEEKLDRAITAAFQKESLRKRDPASGKSPEGDLVLTLFTERGIIPGELGQPFILPDPRDSSRLIVLAGMGVPGRFGVPELTILAQELCWSLGRMERRHLATVLIGAGTGNLSVEDAVGAWLRGIRRALASSEEDAGHQLRRITFVEYNPRTLRRMDEAFRSALDKSDPALRISYCGPSEEQLEDARAEARALAIKKANAEFDRQERIQDADEMVPVRIAVSLSHKTYQFAAITESASVPQRDIPIDPRLVEEANNELSGAESEDQKQCGRFLEKLLIPDDVRGILYTPAPIVLTLDSATARVHWEMVARSDARADARPANGPESFNPEDFLGTSYGLTRQLRTTFAPPPEPPPPPKRTLRVLIVADPAEDAPLPGAQAEAEEVAATFERFNTEAADRTGHFVEVVRLFGPAEAKRTTVLKKLMLENFDVLHFAGHCVYDKEEPSNSGWIFSAERDERITANELKRIDRVPKFIFSNACESGITPDRSEKRNADMAPSFAEAFFARGVANFVCTAWPVDDEAARIFSRRLYSELLGLAPANGFAYMHRAMREARRAIALDAGGTRTWGAYQHYGNPYFQLFRNVPAPKSREVKRPGRKTKSPARKPTAAKRPKAGRKAASSRRR